MSKATDLAELAVILALSAKPHSQALHKSTNAVRNAREDAAKFTQYAAQLSRLALTECNGIERGRINPDTMRWASRHELTEADQERIDHKRSVITQRVAALALDYYTEKRLTDINDKPNSIEFCLDPRGSSAKIAFKAATWAAFTRRSPSVSRRWSAAIA